MICPPDNDWLSHWQPRAEVREVEWVGNGATHCEGKALHVAHRVNHGSGFRSSYVDVAVDDVLDALFADAETATAVMVAAAKWLVAGRIEVPA